MAGDGAEEFDDFCRANYGRLVGSVHLFCGDLGLAEQLTQAALEQAWRRWTRVGQMEDPVAYVRQSAFNLARSHWRRLLAERRANRLHVAGDADAARPAPTEVVLSVRQALADLPPRQRAVMIHRFHGDLTVAETAEAMGTTIGAVKQLSVRARAALKELLGEELDAGQSDQPSPVATANVATDTDADQPRRWA
ncbi:SigE family RNA polymerase sigma factor [Euzebya tangerina]|uniref:SigE family RNA polymerase sigma factor n=1 Tax=Euzebya tangerina TaxID=591198 RepID=UPI000E323DAE|nr:SigE family RNA polymerase sigma factor [Euzebya tangerina]